jgi:translocation and assembly module TamB
MSDAPEGHEPKPAPAAAPIRAREGWLARLTRGLLGACISAIVVVVLLIGWLGGTESGLQAVAELASRLSGGMLRIDGPQGYLLGQLRADVVQVRTPTLQVDILNLRMDWRPGALMSGTLDVSALSASELSVATAPSTDPAALPLSLELPVAVHLNSLAIDRLRIGALVDGKPAEPDMVLTALAGKLDSDGLQHRLSGLRAGAPFGQLTAEGRISGRSPFDLQASAHLSTLQEGEAYEVQAEAAGTLESLTLQARAEGAGLSGEAQVAATPFAPLPVRSVRLQLRDVDPARFHAAAPQARLDVDLDLTPVVASSATTGQPVAPADWVVSGPLRVVNHQPGPYDSGALPVDSLNASLRWAQGELAASGVDLRLPGQGRATGTLRWKAPAPATPGFGQLDADLRIAGLDARRLDRRAVTTRIAGAITARASADTQTLAADLSDARLSLRLKARQAAGVLHLDEALAVARSARLELSGKLALDGAGAFDARGRLSQFDPRAFATAAPPADLNARFELSGKRAPHLVGNLSFELAPSQLEGKPLVGKGELAIDGDVLTQSQVALDLAGNRLTAQGRYGRPGDALELHLDAPALAALGHGLSGSIKADGVFRGTLAQPAGELAVLGEKLAAGELRIDAVNGQGRIAAGRSGALSLQLALAGLRSGSDAEVLVRRASLALTGTREANSTRIEVHGLRQHSAVTTLAGRLSDGPRWDGRLESFEVSGDYPIRLLEPAALLLSRDMLRLGSAELRGGAGGLYRLEETRWQARHLVARGRVSGVQVGVNLDPSTRAVRRQGDSLQMGGEWDVDIGEQANGFVRFYREKGDLILRGDTPVRLGLDDLQLTVSAAASRLAFGFSAHGSQLGSLAGAGSALAERAADGSLRLVPGAPLLGSASLDMPSIAWAGPLADQNLKTDGSLKGEFTLAGTPARPETAGRLRGEKLDFVMADQGLHLSGGTLVADFNREVLRLDELSFVSPNRVRPRESRIDVARLTREPGTLKAAGAIQLASGEGRFSFKAARLPLLQRADQWLVLSGEGEILSGWNSAHLKGRLAADAGFVELSRTPAPSLGDDVEVLDPRRAEKTPASPFRMGVDLALSLGDALYVKALGLDTRLAGELRLQSGDGRPLSATGIITTQGGLFDGYGQRLSIERGIVTFNGPVANPGLNVVALRKGLTVEAGVGITGTARRPVVRLVSEPNVPDPEKLGWIVLGRPPDQGSGGEMALLLPAAQALLGGTGAGLSASLASALGFDEISFGSSIDPRSRVQTSSVATGSVTGTASSASSRNIDSVPGQVITIGKRLSSRAMLSFEQSISGTSSVVKLTYQLTRRISVIGRAGSENALDALFSISFK